MVLINDKKYACDKCIKGHRVSGCTHTDRPLFEVKKKGRPTTQCQHCKDKRKTSGSSVHTKCGCGEPKVPSSAQQPPSTVALTESAASAQSDTPPPSNDVEIETRKGQPGSKATYPNGFRDVHELAAAAGALAGLGDDGAMRVAERSVQALLNPCKCQTGGPCKCCHPKKDKEPSPSRGSPPFSASPTNITASCCASTGPSLPTSAKFAYLTAPVPHLSPENMHHPAHTSPHVHKTKLYSPYSMDPSRLSRREPSSGSRSGHVTPRGVRPPPPRIKPITDVGTLLGAVFQKDGSIANEILRSAVGLPKLPGIQTFDAAAENGGVKVESMAMEDVDMPLAFPTSEDVVIGACMCGEDCACPDCATHNNTHSPGHTHQNGLGCGEGCKSSHHHCGQSLSLPSGLASVSQLIAAAAHHVPRPPDVARFSSIDPHDTRVLPPAASISEDAARTMGYVQLKPLECCNGRCQCPSGQCVCEKECCGCCVRCACAEEDGDATMSGNSNDGNTAIPVEAPASCCSTKNSTAPQPSLNGITPIQTTPIAIHQPIPISLSPHSMRVAPASVQAPSSSSSRHSSPHRSGTTTPVTGNPPPTSLRRAASSSSKFASHHNANATGRRATVTGQPPAVATKAASKASSSQPRPILPKPPSQNGGQLTVPKSSSVSTRQPSPIGKTIPGRVASPGLPRRVSAAVALSTTTSSHEVFTLPPPNPVSSDHQSQSVMSSQPSSQSAPTVMPSISPIAPLPHVAAASTSTTADYDPQIGLDPLMLEFFNSLDSNNPLDQTRLLEEFSSFISQNQQREQSSTFLPPEVPPAMDSTFDLDRFLAEAMDDQSQPSIPQPSDQVETSSSSRFDGSGPSSQAEYYNSFVDFFANSGTTGPMQLEQSHIPVTSNPVYPADFVTKGHEITGTANGAGADFPGIVPGLPRQYSFDPVWPSRDYLPVLPSHAGPSQSRPGSGQAVNHENQHELESSHRSSVHEPSVLDSQSLPRAQSSAPANPDIIDLSKPLDAAALARIMQALQQQQQQEQEQSFIQQQQPYLQLPPQQARSSIQGNVYPSQPAIGNLTIPASNNEPMGLSSAGGAGTTHGLDDMFSAFVTLDGMSSSTSNSDPDKTYVAASSMTQGGENGDGGGAGGGQLPSEAPGTGYIDMRAAQWGQAGIGPALFG